MSAKIKYTDEPIGRIKVVSDFLPTPEELASREEGVKVTLALSKKSVDFFKSEAAKHHTQYQRMIRRLLDSYVETHDRSVFLPGAFALTSTRSLCGTAGVWRRN